MSLTNEERSILVQRELKKAHEAYQDIEILRAAERWNGAANRLYYSVFHAVNALFISDGLEAGHHKTSHSLFSMHYIKTDLLPIDYGRLYNNLQSLREKSDYNCFFDVSEQDIEQGIDIAEDFIQAIERLISRRNSGSNNCLTKTDTPMT